MLKERLDEIEEYRGFEDEKRERILMMMAAAEGAADSGASGKDAVRDSIIQACLGSSEDLANALAAIDEA